MRSVATLLTAALLVGGCTSSEEPTESAPDATPPASTPTAPSSGTPTAAPAKPPHPVSLPAYFDKRYTGGNLRIGETVFENSSWTESYATYRSNGLTISGSLLVPKGPGPFPALVYAHGYIDPAYYVNGQGLNREQDYMAAAGYVVLHVDYRNHAGSSTDPRSDVQLRLPYVEDVVGAVLALKKQRYVDPERVGLLGRSMGGGVVYNALVAQPGLVKAGVVFAPVSSNTVDNFNRWIRRDPSREGIASEVMRRYGTPEKRPGFWARTSARTYFGRITEPLLIHHGTSDDSCPLPWSHATVRALKRAGKDVTLQVYEGEEHAFGPQWPLSMERTLRFFERHM
ncbi:MAG TPA: alpha/beta fold hydrolase [Nocardioidaceae bacterium]|nr:alpha/beta fold hydrolase [Nocardioidaceae bacterium]